MTRPLTPVLFLALVLAAGGAHAKWFDFKADGPEPHKRDMLDQVLARSNKPDYYRQKYAADLITMCHECSHDVNNRITNDFGGVGWYGFYVGGGKATVLREPKIRISDIAPRVQQRWRNFHQYFNVVGPQQDTMPLYILDEWNAAINGAITGHERNAGDTGDRYMACEFSHYAVALLQTVRELDPSYPQMSELVEFIDYEKARTKLVNSLPKQPSRPGMSGTETFVVRTQSPGQLVHVSQSYPSCYSETSCPSCPGGQCYPSNNDWQPPRQVVTNPPQPTQPKPDNEDIKRQWIAYIDVEINKRLTKISQCKCQGCMTDKDLKLALAQLRLEMREEFTLAIKNITFPPAYVPPKPADLAKDIEKHLPPIRIRQNDYDEPISIPLGGEGKLSPFYIRTYDNEPFNKVTLGDEIDLNLQRNSPLAR